MIRCILYAFNCGALVSGSANRNGIDQGKKQV